MSGVLYFGMLVSAGCLWHYLEDESTSKIVFLYSIGIVVALFVLLALFAAIIALGNPELDIKLDNIFTNQTGNKTLRFARLVLGVSCVVLGIVSFSLCIDFMRCCLFIAVLVLGGFYEIFRAFAPARNARVRSTKPNKSNRIVHPGLVDIDRYSGRQFEYYCAELMRLGGFRQVGVTKGSGDHGADIIAVDTNGVRWAVQCKRYSAKLGNSPVQEVVASMAHYRAQRAAVITNAGFTEGAIILANDNGVVLIDRGKLAAVIGRRVGLTLYDMK